MFDIQEIRSQFPILQEKVNGKDLVYLDNAATSQKPLMVLDAINDYYSHYNANVHRGIHTLSQVATEAMEDARKKVHQFINAKHDYEVLFTKGTTEGVNLVAYAITDLIKKMMKLSFLIWNTILILFPGRYCVREQVQNSV